MDVNNTSKISILLLTALLTVSACSDKKKQEEAAKENPTEQTIDSTTTEVVESMDAKDDHFFDDWQRQPFKGTMLMDDRSEERKLEAIRIGKDPAYHFQAQFENFRLIIFDYGTFETAFDYENPDEYRYHRENWNVTIRGLNDYEIMPVKNTDSVTINEYVFHDLSNKLVRITPLKKGDYFKLSASLSLFIHEQHDYTKKECEADDWWDEKAVKWEGMSHQYTIADSAKYYFRIPVIDKMYESDFDKIYSAFNMRDTLVDRSGESSNVATLVYKEKPCLFSIPHIVLRIERYSKENILVETKYMTIEFSYGC